MIDLQNPEGLRSLDNEMLGDELERLVEGRVSHLNEVMIRNILKESFGRNDPNIAWNALEIVALRNDVEVTDILVNASKQEQESSVAIFLIEQLLERSDQLDCDVFLSFLSSKRGDLVRETAARALLVLGKISEVETIKMIFRTDKDVLVRLNISALLFLLSHNQRFYSFVQERCNDQRLEVAREAR